MQVSAHIEARLEVLDSALSAYLRSDATVTSGPWGRAEAIQLARDESRLIEAAVACGMSRDEPSVSGWASAKAARWLCGANMVEV